MIEDHAVGNEYTFHTYWSTARWARLWQTLHGVGLVSLQYHMHQVAGELSNSCITRWNKIKILRDTFICRFKILFLVH